MSDIAVAAESRYSRLAQGKNFPMRSTSPDALSEVDSLQLPLFEVTEEGGPAPFVLARIEAYADNVVVSFRVHSYGHEDRDAMHFAPRVSLKPDAVEKDVRIVFTRG